MTSFLERARSDIGTAPIAALNVGARRFSAHRDHAVEAFPAMDDMRDRAREIRLHTLANLDRYLAQFADTLEAAGGDVFFAADAREANDYVVQLARARGVQRIVKSKSMLTEELRLNDALEAEGMEVVETDLGELIVQLAEDRPSHIIAPVLHKTRFEVGALFEEKLGVPYTDDPIELNSIARRHLRPLFLTADMGISGVNVAVAQTGSICIVTNEGNGRLTTTAPRIHVAMLGAERLVPSIGDMSVILEVLARSATGQKLSVYTNVLTGPRRPGEPDGPDELHVVIVDNGRSKVLEGQGSEILACIRCGACLNVCPVYRTVGGHAYGSTYPGPVGSVLTPALFDLDEWSDLPYASTLCGACLEVCPVRIDIPRLLLGQRRLSVQTRTGPMWMRRPLRAYASAATHPRRFRALLRIGAAIGRLFRSGWILRLPWRGAAWTQGRDLQTPAKSFHRRWKGRNRGS
ncbi:lactate utilization protein B [bacterium BMS3Abin02]|nr:lactate utilization protein B [bacterium BMS3Abin02]HDL48980.1 iron-sulfur cluster-binding protein [Actinomycetota bacterium]